MIFEDTSIYNIKEQITRKPPSFCAGLVSTAKVSTQGKKRLLINNHRNHLNSNDAKKWIYFVLPAVQFLLNTSVGKKWPP